MKRHATCYQMAKAVTAKDEFGSINEIEIRFANGSVGVMNLNAIHCPNWQMSEYFAVARCECWLEVRDMMLLNYHPKTKPLPEFTLRGRAQTLTWTPEFTEVLGLPAEGLVGYKGEIQDFARAILGRETTSANFFDGAEAIRIAEAIWRSAKQARPVSLQG